MFGIGKVKVNPKYCPECNGSGVIVRLETPKPPAGRMLTVPEMVKKESCPRCRGIGLVGIPGIENVPFEKLGKLTEGKTSDELMMYFKGKTPAEVEVILRKL